MPCATRREDEPSATVVFAPHPDQNPKVRGGWNHAPLTRCPRPDKKRSIPPRRGAERERRNTAEYWQNRLRDGHQAEKRERQGRARRSPSDNRLTLSLRLEVARESFRSDQNLRFVHRRSSDVVCSELQEPRLNMKGLLALLLSGLILIVPAARRWGLQGAASAATDAGVRVPVVLELFTSEGCSSCPPADALLARLEEQQPIPNAQVIALEEHVDYWNSQGWTDPFSNREWTLRQQDYASSLKNRNPYTPQVVIDGHTELVGSREGQARQAIEAAAAQPK